MIQKSFFESATKTWHCKNIISLSLLDSAKTDSGNNIQTSQFEIEYVLVNEKQLKTGTFKKTYLLAENEFGLWCWNIWKMNQRMILSEVAMKNELKEIYSIVRKGHKIKSEYPNGDYYS